MRTELTRWDPLKEMATFQEGMNKIFSSFWGRTPFRTDVEGFWSPLINVEDTKDEIIVKAEIPGMKKEEIKLQVTGDSLTITGEKKYENITKDATVYVNECSYGKFQRVINFPTEVQANKAKATYENGILMIKLPKSEECKLREIPIEVK